MPRRAKANRTVDAGGQMTRHPEIATIVRIASKGSKENAYIEEAKAILDGRQAMRFHGLQRLQRRQVLSLCRLPGRCTEDLLIDLNRTAASDLSCRQDTGSGRRLVPIERDGLVRSRFGLSIRLGTKALPR